MNKFLVKLIFVALMFQTIGCKSQNDIKKEKIDASDILRMINKNEKVQIINSVIVGDLDFTNIENEFIESKGIKRAYVEVPITFVDCDFEGAVKAFSKDEDKFANYVCFERSVTFLNCKFKDEAFFREAIFNGPVNFSGSSFDKKAIFEGILLRFKTNYFSECYFSDDARFQRIYVYGDLNFMKSTFVGKVKFQKSNILGITQFSDAKFMNVFDFGSSYLLQGLNCNFCDFAGNLRFNNVVILGKAEFNHCQFAGLTEMRNTSFYEMLNFEESNFLDSVNFDNSRFYIAKPDFNKAVFNAAKVSYQNTKLIESKNIENITNQK